MRKIRKAAVATAGTFGAALGVAMLDGHLDGAELLTTAGSALVVGFAAWRVPNAKASAGRRHRRPQRVVGQ